MDITDAGGDSMNESLGLDPLARISKFIAQLNVHKKHHIGYVGDQEEEILKTLHEEFNGEGRWERYFTQVLENDRIIGVLGLNIDEETGNAEMWGPYIDGTDQDYITVAADLWNRGIAKVGNVVREYHGFYNKENVRSHEFMEYLQAKKMGGHMIMKLKKPGCSWSLDHAVQKISPEWHEDFIRLHARTFPNTYYNAENVLQLANKEDNRLYVAIVEGNFAGYCYTEAEPDFQEGNIEYIAVDELYRGKGIGKNLLYAALNDLFFKDSIHEVSICVDEFNAAAAGLYRCAGFYTDNVLQYYKVTI